MAIDNAARSSTALNLLNNPSARQGLSYNQLVGYGLSPTEAQQIGAGFNQSFGGGNAKAWDASHGYTIDAGGNVVPSGTGTPAYQTPLGSATMGNQIGYTPSYQGWADATVAQQLQQMSNPANNTAAQVLPQIQSNVSNIVNNPYASGAINAAQQAGQAYTNVGNQALAGAGIISGLTPQIQQMLSQLSGAAFDPQQELYNRTQHQLQEQTRAGLEARGLDMSPVGAGIENQAMSDFNIDWQNNQLQRMLQGAQGYGSLDQLLGSNLSGATDLGLTGASAIGQGGTLPYDTQNQISGNNIAALQNLGQAGTSAQALPQQNVQNLLNYLGGGRQATQIQNLGNAASLEALTGAASGIAGGVGNLLSGGGVGDILSGGGDLLNSIGDLFGLTGSDAGQNWMIPGGEQVDLGNALPWLTNGGGGSNILSDLTSWLGL